MNTIHLKEFIKTGKFGTISIGSTKSDLVNALGKKFDKWGSKFPNLVMRNSCLMFSKML